MVAMAAASTAPGPSPGLLALLLSLVSIANAFGVNGNPSRPNIVFILADDMGYGDAGYLQVGSDPARRIKTPSLDRMATEGLCVCTCV